VFQSFQLLGNLTALENVMLPLELMGRPDARAAATEMLRRVGLSERLRHYPKVLSGGEQQRVALARAFVVRRRAAGRRATGSLDFATGATVMELMFELNARPARRWCWSPTTPPSPRAATASCASRPGASSNRRGATCSRPERRSAGARRHRHAADKAQGTPERALPYEAGVAPRYIFSTSWQELPQALVYGIGIALPAATPLTPLFVMRGTSNRCEVMSFIQ